MRNRILDVLTHDQTSEVYQASLQILEKVGVAFFHEGALKLFHQNGADVDFKKSLVKFPPSLVKDTLKKVQSRFSLYYQDMSKRVDVGVPNKYLYAMDGMCPSILDHETGERREATVYDLENGTILADAIENVDLISPTFVPSDVPRQLIPIKQMEILANNTNKIIGVEPLTPMNVETIVEMAKVVTGDEETLRKKPTIALSFICPDSPLKFSTEAINELTACIAHDIPIDIDPCPISGVSGPITLAGMVAQIVAEGLAGIVYTKLLKKDIPVTVSLTPFTMNYKEGNLLYGSPETVLMEMACAQLFRYLSIPSHSGFAATDSKILTVQTGYERMMGILMAVFSGTSWVSPGIELDECGTSSLRTIVISGEMVQAVERLLDGINVSPETLAVDVFQEVGQNGSFLEHKHTRDHFKSEHWLPELSFKGSWRTFEEKGRRTIIDNTDAKILRLLENRESKLDRDQKRQLELIVKEAAKLYT